MERTKARARPEFIRQGTTAVKYTAGIALIFLLALLSGCDNTPDIANPLSYSKDGITFSYPGNWRVSDSGGTESTRYVIAEGPGDILFIAQIYPRDEAVELDEFAEWFSEEAGNNMPIGKADSTSFSAINQHFGEKRLTGVREEVSMVLLGVKVPHVREYYAEPSSDQVVFMVGQAPREDWTAVEPGLSLIISTFNAGTRKRSHRTDLGPRTIR